MPRALAVEHVRGAVLHARDRGAEVVGLGAYTSIVTSNGEALEDVGLPLTTGNGFTAVVAADAVRTAARALDLDMARCRVAIVGATDSVGRACALLLAREVGSLHMVGNPAHAARSLERLPVVSKHVRATMGVHLARGQSNEFFSVAGLVRENVSPDRASTC